MTRMAEAAASTQVIHMNRKHIRQHIDQSLARLAASLDRIRRPAGDLAGLAASPVRSGGGRTAESAASRRKHHGIE